MGFARIWTAGLAAALTLCSLAACAKEPSPQTAPPSGEGTPPPIQTAPEVPKTPTPQLPFDSEKYPGHSNSPTVRPEDPGGADDGAPRYPVDAVPDPAMADFSDLSPLFAGLISAPDGATPTEQGINLFDGYESSKFCFRPVGQAEVIWSMDSEVPVSAYALATGNDTADFPDRNPASWELYGSPDGTDGSWTLIDSVDAPALPAANYQYKGYLAGHPGSYRFFRFVMVPTAQDGYIQLSELRLYTSDPAAAGLADGYAPEGKTPLFEEIDRASLSGPAGVSGHGLECLFDNRVSGGESGSNKYCVGLHDVTLEWQMRAPATVCDYVIFTANDCTDHPQRNPIRWTLSGSTDGKTYTVIHEVENANLPVSNYAPTAFSTGCTVAYTYYRLEMHAVTSADCIQLSEISLYGPK